MQRTRLTYITAETVRLPTPWELSLGLWLFSFQAEMLQLIRTELRAPEETWLPERRLWRIARKRVLTMTYQTSQWLSRPPLGTARIGLAGATARGRVYAIAGFAENDTFNSVEARAQKPPKSTWHTQPSVDIRRANCAADTLDGLIYVVGGLKEDGAPTDSVQRFDPKEGGSWEASRSLPAPRTHMGVAGHGGRLYVAGGAENGATMSMVAYDHEEDEWIDRAPIPSLRGLFRLVAAGGHLYAIGGFAGVATNTDPQTTVERYDPVSDRWESVARLHEPRGNPGVAAFGKGSRHIAVVGGVTSDDQGHRFSLKSSEVYDINDDEWQVLDVQLPHSRASLVCALEARNTVLAIGGAVTDDQGNVAAADLVEAIRIHVSGDDDNDDDNL
jgi:hypothetical protein